MRICFQINNIKVCGHIYNDLDQTLLVSVRDIIYSTVISILNLRKLSSKVVK